LANVAAQRTTNVRKRVRIAATIDVGGVLRVARNRLYPPRLPCLSWDEASFSFAGPVMRCSLPLRRLDHLSLLLFVLQSIQTTPSAEILSSGDHGVGVVDGNPA
jgi:hypothetical protein